MLETSCVTSTYMWPHHISKQKKFNSIWIRLTTKANPSRCLWLPYALQQCIHPSTNEFGHICIMSHKMCILFGFVLLLLWYHFILKWYELRIHILWGCVMGTSNINLYFCTRQEENEKMRIMCIFLLYTAAHYCCLPSNIKCAEWSSVRRYFVHRLF